MKNIAAALCAADADDCADFRANAAAYTNELEALDAAIKAGFDAIPAERAQGHHHARRLRLFRREPTASTFLAPQGVSTDREASAADVAELIEQIRRARA